MDGTELKNKVPVQCNLLDMLQYNYLVLGFPIFIFTNMQEGT